MGQVYGVLLSTRWGYVEQSAYRAMAALMVALGLASIVMWSAGVLATGAALSLGLLIAAGLHIALACRTSCSIPSPWILALGLSHLVMAVITLMPLLSGRILPLWLVAAVFLVEGINRLAIGIALRPRPHWSLTFMTGLVALAIGLLVLAKAMPVAWTAALLGALWVAAGLSWLALAATRQRFDPSPA